MAAPADSGYYIAISITIQHYYYIAIIIILISPEM